MSHYLATCPGMAAQEGPRMRHGDARSYFFSRNRARAVLRHTNSVVTWQSRVPICGSAPRYPHFIVPVQDQPQDPPYMGPLK
jgi:hypothetical protein